MMEQKKDRADFPMQSIADVHGEIPMQPIADVHGEKPYPAKTTKGYYELRQCYCNSAGKRRVRTLYHNVSLTNGYGRQK